MALTDLQVYNRFTYLTMTEVLTQNVNLFNQATENALMLSAEPSGGDFKDEIFYGAVPGLVRRRNPYGDGAVTEKVMNQKVDTLVKVAAGTPPVRMDPAWFAWIQRSPEEAAAAMGQQLAKQTLADMINVALGSVTAALSNNSAIINDISGGVGASAPAATNALPSPLALANTAGKLGDYMSEIVCWVMHSKSLTDLYGNALSNNERLFSYGNVNVVRDPFGRVYIMTDASALMEAADTTTTNGKHNAWFHTLGLTPGAVEIETQADFYANVSETNGNENIHRTYQAEWSYMVGVKGFSWDKANGAKAPNDAALFTATNWDQIVASIKDGPGVFLKSQ